MKCQLCASPATVHFTKIVNKSVTEFHLCQTCAAKQQIPSLGDLSLSAILQSLIGQQVGTQAEELSRLTCPTCGIKYMEFRGEGRLGCPGDYALFRDGLEPILQRVHRATRHVGKVPRRRNSASQDSELLELRQRLRRAVESEAYEEAARLRDVIRRKEASDASG
ncbi:MAG: UvrB/UvrC motif-containing protein [Gemmataceae bacterium]